MSQPAEHTASARVMQDIMVPMRDGVRLACDIFLPEDSSTGPWPVLLERTPYDKRAPRTNEYTVAHPQVFGRRELAGFFTAAGFVVVFQDCRGRYASEGRFTKYRGEAEDGAETLAWIAAQDWCDGQIGTMGMSYSAHTQMAAAALSPPGLAAMVLDCGGFSNAYQGGIRFGGALELKQVTWAFRHALRSRAAAADPVAKAALEATDIAAWFRRMPWKRGHSPLSPIPDYEDYLFDQWDRTLFDDYWKIPALYAAGYHDRMPPVPSVHMSGWYDPYACTAIKNFSGLRALGHPARLIMGPWTHGNRSRTYAGKVDFGPDATFEAATGCDFVAWRIAYFSRHLQGADDGAEQPVRFFLMGGGSGQHTAEGRLDHGGRWITAQDWPPPDATPMPLYLTPQGGLDPRLPREAGTVGYIFDPEDPVPTIGGPITSGAPVMVGGAFDQREEAAFFGSRAPGMPLTSRADVLVFESEPLAQDVAVAGNVSVDLTISSDRPTTDFTAKLVDVWPRTAEFPHGFAMNLCDGILRTPFREGFDRLLPLEPDTPVTLTIPMYPTANLFRAGHRIRLEVSSSNFPRFDVNPNAALGDDLSQQRHKASNTLHFGPGVVARLNLMQIPTGA
ncbi:CocE/NonD family hydrolase [Roseicitreum antarcticum]|uniref:Xaa-Pro dipeptidyl-peptidase C-terminal domain-containing protein n=1 Tax=Roseicitreum antarcticum TaxID=564137 RepID=A0A1H2VQW3_9RHOB|nr:CocE/NonD family hydrolase [Roseicitreum antarcticum]SDW70691.1 hypothetical protein SAMN04488238_103146 [Roseicitreum antarcticum]